MQVELSLLNMCGSRFFVSDTLTIFPNLAHNYEWEYGILNMVAAGLNQLSA